MTQTTQGGNALTVSYFPLINGQINTDESAITPGLSGAGTALVGVCFSGGGSRSLSATLGQLRGLDFLGLLDKTLFISSVSGGSWASTLYTFLPKTITDNDFLGEVVPDPNRLWWIPFNYKADSANLNYLTPNNMGNVPSRLGFLQDIEQLVKLKETYHYQMHELWVRLIGKQVFEPFGLSSVIEDKSNPAYGHPAKFYSLNSIYVEKAILARNPQLTLNDFYLTERKRPFLIVNTSMFKDNQKGAELLPVESTAVGCGIRQSFPGGGINGMDIGGGLVQPLGFGGTHVSPLSGNAISVEVPYRFSLSDISGLSSAAFAEAIEARFPAFNGLIPQYNYYPVNGAGEAKNPSTPYMFADGGNLENTGIMALLARNLSRIVVFINCQDEIEEKSTHLGKVISVDSQLPPLFGYMPLEGDNGYQKYGEIPPPINAKPFSHNMVFPSSSFQDLLNNLWKAKQSGGPVMYLQRNLQVLENDKFNIRGNYNADVLWVYNSMPQKWWSQLSLPLRAELDGDFVQFGDFPHYNTILQLKLSPAQVNLLAHMHCWNIIQDNIPVSNTGLTSRQIFSQLYQ